jgi:hypothetical protein
MTTNDWQIKRDLRIDLLFVANVIQNLTIKYRNAGLRDDFASDLNDLQIKVTELMGRLMSVNPKDQ